ncbi:MAG: protoporphyrinogen oxidase HemJ [Archangiaceae bacterium]|nr:protoporphyrinogen oxidase HemJ [Archangiaceae bacterium]
MFLWLKTLHIIAVISWMAGLLYIFRLYVYHAMETEQVVRDRFQVMERRLLNAITTPAAIVAVITGVWMIALIPGWLSQGWLHLKLTMVVLLLGTHAFAIVARKRLITAPTTWNHKFFRVMNELPTLLMIIIVGMVIFKPLLWS